ncbi:MAG: hypothetical protein U9N52_07840 [Campylobacterota bacterium]|nr:hypothetical protein [Campylobacterota bacterium]
MEKLKKININDIRLDLHNPRLPLSIRKGEGTKSTAELDKDVLTYLIKTGSITELILSIGENGFFAGEALLLVKNEDEPNKYTVVEGNRRVTALKLLHNPSLATASKNKIAEASSMAKVSLDDLEMIPSIIFSSRQDIIRYLGYRHITGIKDWKALEKARYMYDLYSHFKTPSNTDIAVYKDISKSIGSTPSYVKRILKAYDMYLYVEQKDFFNISGLNDTTFYFVNLSDSLNKPNIKIFLLETNDNREFNEVNLEKLIKWIFEETGEGNTRLKGTSSDLKDLDMILSNPKALALFESKEASLSTAVFFAEDTETILSISLEKALQHLEEAHRVLPKIQNFNSVSKFDDNLLEIRTIAKNLFSSKKERTQSLDDDI